MKGKAIRALLRFLFVATVCVGAADETCSKDDITCKSDSGELCASSSHHLSFRAWYFFGKKSGKNHDGRSGIAMHTPGRASKVNESRMFMCILDLYSVLLHEVVE